MSVELLPVREPDGTTEAVQGISVGGSKPLHRFLKGQPKIIGTAVLIMGVSFVTVSIAISSDHYGDLIWITIPPGIFLGTLFIICGILYILTEHKPTKKTVTISLALTIVTILAACWTLLHVMVDLHMAFGVYDYEFHYNETETDTLWRTHYNVMGRTLEAVHAVYSFVAVIIFIVMSVLAGAALRSTKTQAIVVMNVTAPETPVE